MMRAFAAIPVFALLLSTAACGHDPEVHARFPAGQSVEDVLRELTKQRPHLYVAVRDEAALRQRLAFGVEGEMPMSVFVRRFADATQLDAQYYPFELNSPRATLKVSSRGIPSSSAIYVVITGGVVRPQRQPR